MSVDTKTRMAQIVEKVQDLPPLPAIVPRVLKLISDPDSKISELSETLGSDQAIASKVLRLANSAFYGFPRRIATLTDAVILLGFKTIKGLIYAITLYDTFNRETKGYGMKKGELWKHSLAVAITSRSIAKDIGTIDPEQAFIAGLLHDIGKTILDQYLMEDFDRVISITLSKKISFNDAEKEIFGFDHTELGEQMIIKWNLPTEFQESTRYHHSPLEAPNEDNILIPIVHISDAVVLMLGVGLGADGMFYPMEEEVLPKIGKDISYINKLVEQAQKNLCDIDSMLNL